MAQIYGTSGSDTLTGTAGDDAISGFAGNDSLSGDLGNDTIYGGDGDDTVSGGDGNDVLYGDSIPQIYNLLVNGSFEQSGSTYQIYGFGRSNTTLPGWTKTNTGNFEQVNSGVEGVQATDGHYWLDLDASPGAGSNMAISQTVAGLTAGELLTLQFDHANRGSSSTGSFEVYWNGTLIATITSTGTTMLTETYQVTAVAGNNTLSFQALGSQDGVGASLDNVLLYDSAAIGTNNGNDIITGGLGDDILIGGAGADSLDGGAGSDTISYYNSASAVTVNLLAGTASGGDAQGDTFTGIENVTGSASNDVLTGDSGNNILDGGRGADTLTGGLGNDVYVVDNTGDVVIEAAGEGIDEIRTNLSSYTLTSANIENLTGTSGSPQTLIGNSGDNVITSGGGEYGGNWLQGLGGNDTLTGGDGDALDGGDGDDTFYWGSSTPAGNIVGGSIYAYAYDSSGSDTGYVNSDLAQLESTDVEHYVLQSHVSAGVLTGSTLILTSTDNIWITGSAQKDSAFGGSGNDTIETGDGNDTLLGGGGADVLNGGNGTDTVLYWSSIHSVSGGVTVDLKANTATGAGGEANGDTFISVENVYGTNFSDQISGDDGANTLGGQAGDDILEGYAGDDVLLGSSGADALYGDDGNDTLDGGSGADDLQGNLGNDIYIVDDINDLITEWSGEGTDEIRTGLASYALPTNISAGEIENLTGTSNSGQSLTGNQLANVITAGSGADTLNGLTGADTMRGGAGNDTYVVDNAGDVVTENASAGTDLVQTTLATYTLGSNVENLTYTGSSTSTMTGNSLNNVITGSTGNDTLSGGAGSDTMIGGAGNDTYLVDSAGDVVTEAAAGGTDTVRGSVATYVIASEVENFIYTGTGGGNITGNASNNSITGATGADTLSGGDGNDTLTGLGGADTLDGGNGNDVINGGAGADTLTGGANNDTFTFANGDTANGAAADRIQDFTSGLDKINVAAIDANTAVSGDQAFSYLGSGAFTGVAGQLHYVVSGSDTLIQGDTNGDSIADFTITLTGILAPVSTDFTL